MAAEDRGHVVDAAFDAVLAGDNARVMCVGGLRTDECGACCDVWRRFKVPDPRLGKKLLAAMELCGHGDDLDDDERKLIEKWPMEQLEAVVLAIQRVCEAHQSVDPALSTLPRKGPASVAILIADPDETSLPKKRPVKVIFEHPEFKR